MGREIDPKTVHYGDLFRRPNTLPIMFIDWVPESDPRYIMFYWIGIDLTNAEIVNESSPNNAYIDIREGWERVDV